MKGYGMGAWNWDAIGNTINDVASTASVAAGAYSNVKTAVAKPAVNTTLPITTSYSPALQPNQPAKNNTMMIVAIAGGAVLLGGGIYLATRKKKK